MTIFSALSYGVKMLRAHRYAVWIIYLTTFALALLFVLPFQQLLSNEIGNSLEIDTMLEAYRHTVFADFMNMAGAQLFGLLGQIKWLILIYVLASIFFSAAIMAICTQNERGLSAFFRGGSVYFWQFLRLALYIWIAQIFVAALIHFPFISQLLQGLDSIQNEISFFRMGFIGLCLHIPIALLIFAIADFTKAHIVLKGEKRVLKSLWKTILDFRTFFLKRYMLYVVNGLLIAGLYGIYLLLSNWIDMSTGFTIVVMFFLQQVVSLLRIAAKIVKLGSVLSMNQALETQPHSLGISHK